MPVAMQAIVKRSLVQRVTLVYGAREERFNNAAAMKARLEARLDG